MFVSSVHSAGRIGHPWRQPKCKPPTTRGSTPRTLGRPPTTASLHSQLMGTCCSFGADRKSGVQTTSYIFSPCYLFVPMLHLCAYAMSFCQCLVKHMLTCRVHATWSKWNKHLEVACSYALEHCAQHGAYIASSFLQLMSTCCSVGPDHESGMQLNCQHILCGCSIHLADHLNWLLDTYCFFEPTHKSGAQSHLEHILSDRCCEPCQLSGASHKL